MRRTIAVMSLGASVLLVVAGLVRPAGAAVAPVGARGVAATVDRSVVASTGTVASGVRIPANGSFVTALGSVWRLVGGALVYVSSWVPYGGRHRTMPLTAAQYAAVGHTHIRDGQFIRTIQDGAVYRVVDGTPLYVSSWAAVGGPHPTIGIDLTNLRHAGLPGPWGALKSFAGADVGFLDPDHLSTPSVSVAHFVRSSTDGRVYVLTNGAPLYVTSWAPFGGPHPTVLIDGADIAHGGQGGRWRFLRWYPEDGLDMLDAVSKPGGAVSMFAVAGGAPIYVPYLNNFPEAPLDYNAVDPVAIARAGSGGPFNHLRARPADGTFLYAYHDANVQMLDFPHALYWVSGGAAIPVTNEKACPTVLPGEAQIDRVAVDNAATGGVWDHLAKPPVPAPTPPC